MLLRPLRRTPMMLGGVGFQIGLDEARRKAAREAAAAAQLSGLQALLDDGTLTPEEFATAKRKWVDPDDRPAAGVEART
jgi:hypothetical protein